MGPMCARVYRRVVATPCVSGSCTDFGWVVVMPPSTLTASARAAAALRPRCQKRPLSLLCGRCTVKVDHSCGGWLVDSAACAPRRGFCSPASSSSALPKADAGDAGGAGDHQASTSLSTDASGSRGHDSSDATSSVRDVLRRSGSHEPRPFPSPEAFGEGAAFSASAGDIPPVLSEGPILADYLAMGAGRKSSSSSPSSSSSSPAREEVRDQAVQSTGDWPPSAERAARAAPVSSSAYRINGHVDVRERRLIEAALLKSEALAQEPSAPPEFSPYTDAPLQSRRTIPALFAESYAGHTKALDSQPADARPQPRRTISEQAAAVPSAGSVPRLRMQDWHRSELRQMVCKALVSKFSKEAARQNMALWWFELEDPRTEELVREGKVAALVRHLAEVELHAERGSRRNSRMVKDLVSPEWWVRNVKEERRILSSRWKLWLRKLHEDAIFRLYLDGSLSWPRVRCLLGPPPPPSSRQEREAMASFRQPKGDDSEGLGSGSDDGSAAE
eukprot:TRINITY_DN112155_c0_g1_i1.p1 TRINITY_DN112155_c0_g1~~TRINITY_DN112155_c0_g1_i1.p1  ORF type:complete len:503 (-),score=95.03 TRINITY_DN112155_c0_g1_i1:16-1524(-)